jgi:beta-aspartyl-peptidase (threonine type)
MWKYIPVIILALSSCKQKEAISDDNDNMTAPAWAIVIHGGAGYQRPDNHDSTKVATVEASLNAALDVGQDILSKGGSSLDAVEAVIRLMEDDTLFNAGRGAVYTHEGENEHDASIMYGADRNSGATAGTKTIKHPISAARAVMEKSPHVMLAGRGAETFAQTQGIELVDPAYFKVQNKWNRIQKVLQKEAAKKEEKFGTVGCVALDKDGHITAGTSTGGMTNKQYNRIGDSPIIGAGTFADDKTCGVSSTGHGEYFIRYTVARDIAARMEYAGEDLETAANTMVNEVLVEAGGSGGIVALDRYGNIAMPFNTKGMYRGYAGPDGREVLIFKE